jgi:5-hydroxyisourate hydrolase
MSVKASRRKTCPCGWRGETPPANAGLYRLAFDTASYHLAEEIRGLYPVVEITFEVREGESHFHIPLLLSPYGYTTYRGS